MPLNVIFSDQNKSDNFNRMKTTTGDFYLVIFSKWDFWNVEGAVNIVYGNIVNGNIVFNIVFSRGAQSR